MPYRAMSQPAIKLYFSSLPIGHIPTATAIQPRSNPPFWSTDLAACGTSICRTAPYQGRFFARFRSFNGSPKTDIKRLYCTLFILYSFNLNYFDIKKLKKESTIVYTLSFYKKVIQPYCSSLDTQT